MIPFSLKDAPALIERLLPVQKLSAEAYKEQMAVHGKTLTALGSYWKGRKPLILAKACVLGCLLPATDNANKDLEVFEMLMGMDDESFLARGWRGVTSAGTPIECHPDMSAAEYHRLAADAIGRIPYQTRVSEAKRPEEVADTVHQHIWEHVNAHLGTSANSFPDLTEQLGIMRFGHRPKVGDTFCGSGQIPFEAARLGCDVYASDLNPIACMLTWGAFEIVGGTPENHDGLVRSQRVAFERVQSEIDRLGIETDGAGWRAKVFLYCVEVRCPQTGWMVPLLGTRVISKGYRVIAELVPDHSKRRYDVMIRSPIDDDEFAGASEGTVRSDGRGQEPYMIHTLNGAEYRTKISTLRGDHRRPDGSTANRLRAWQIHDVIPVPNDVFQERLYCIQWMRPKKRGTGWNYEFRSVTDDDVQREQIVVHFVQQNLADWQEKGWVPDMRIEAGEKTDEPIRTRGWTYWHHLFNPRQLLLAALVNSVADARLKFSLTQVLNNNCRSSRWHQGGGGGGLTVGIFDNQALNTLYNYGCRGSEYAASFLLQAYRNYPLFHGPDREVRSHPAYETRASLDIFITDPPYGDAVKYEEILEFFIAWLEKHPPPQFADWTWDSRRALAITGEGEDFRRRMVAAYTRMRECMPDNGIQVIMFTHQSGSLWADMANIVWASGLRVTAAWYVVTETDSALREGSYVKGTVLLILRKRAGLLRTTRDDLAWEIQEEVEKQIADLTGLNQQAKGLYRDQNVFEDADVQMAGYAAALRVLTQYGTIDGRDMTAEAVRPRVRGETTFVDSLIAFAVDTANRCLVPDGISKSRWQRLTGVERFYLKMLDMESRGVKTLDNYQNFAKAFKVGDFKPFLASQRANDVRLKGATEFGRTEMSEGSEMHQSVLRAVLYAIMEIEASVDAEQVIAHLRLNVENYFSDPTQRETVADLADYLAGRLVSLRAEEASAARVLRELVRNQRLG